MKKLMKKRIFKAVIALVCIVTMLAAVAYTFFRSGEEETAYAAEPQPISPKVSVGRNTYTADDKLQILEIVPDHALAELGYLVGGNSAPVRLEDILEIQDENTRVNILQQWMQLIDGQLFRGSNFSIQFGLYEQGATEWYSDENGNWYSKDGEWGWQWYDYSADWSKQGTMAKVTKDTPFRIAEVAYNENWQKVAKSVLQYKDDDGNVVNTLNMFAYAVFGCFDMCDKIEIVVKKPSEVTVEDVKNSDLIYFNMANHDATYKNVYTSMIAASDKYSADGDLSKLGSNTNHYHDMDEELSAEVAWELYMAYSERKTALIFDRKTTEANYSPDSNMQIIATLIMNGDRDIVKEQFWQNKNSDTFYNGTVGKVEIDKENDRLVFSYLSNGSYKEIEWAVGGLAYVPELNGDYNGLNNYVNETYVNEVTNDNVYWYNGDNSMDMTFLLGSRSGGSNGHRNSMDKVEDMFGDENGNISFRDMILYILGAYAYEPFTGTLEVLEIEPAGAYQYNISDRERQALQDAGSVINDVLDKEKAEKILDYLGLYARKNDETFNERIHVTSIAMNGFIGMEEDICSNYDLVILSDYNPEGYIDTSVTKIYATIGQEVTITDHSSETNNTYKAALGGNDLTQKAYEKLLEYIERGMPMVLGDSIFYAETNTTTIGEDTRVAQLSYKKLTEAYGENINVTSESNGSGTMLLRCNRPTFTVADNLQYKISNGVAVPNLTKDDLAAVTFSGKVNNPNSTKGYSLQVYIDKDANGIYSETTDDDNELLGDFDTLILGTDGSFSVTLQEMPDTLRGYLQWKAVLTDKATGMSGDLESAFVVKYPDEELKKVKVLQITPGGDKITLTLNDAKFTQMFDAVSNVTGLDMEVTTLTCEEFEALYENKPFRLINGVAQNDILSKRKDSGYDMVVLGFADIYGENDISDANGALSNLKYYVQMGNSILMSHDVMSFTAYSDGTVDGDGNVVNKATDFANRAANLNWSYNITSALRSIIGMDHYYTNSLLEVWTRAKTYRNTTVGNTAYNRTTKVKQLNNGQISNYPYYIGEEVEVARTHTQYFQLDLEAQSSTGQDDVVVWYTLGTVKSYLDGTNWNTTDVYLNYSGQDALNNYYIYSKGNITYSGAGHSDITGDKELQLFVNTIIRAIGAGNNLPEVVYEDVISIGDGRYEMAVRDNPDALDSIMIKYKATDEDMSKNGKFKYGYVFCDINANGIYDAGTDILLVEYSESTSEGKMVNGKEYELDLKDYLGNDEIKKRFDSNTLTLTVQATDNNNGIGIATLDIINKTLFELN